MKQTEIFLSLKKRTEIAELFTRGKILYSKTCMIRYVSHEEKSALPMGVLWTVPRKMRRAVDRNRLRRVMKAALYQAFCEPDVKLKEDAPAIHMAILPRKEFETLPFPERVYEMKTILHRLGYTHG